MRDRTDAARSPKTRASAEPSSAAGRDLQREETRRRVHTAALEVFRRDGVQNARIEDIAQAAGVSRGTFYFHFPTREDVLAELLAVSEERIAAKIDRLPTSTRLTSVFDVVCSAIASEWEADPALFPEVGVVALKAVAARGVAARHGQPVRTTVATRVRAAVERGEVNAKIPAELLADLFLVNVFGAALAWSQSPEIPLGVVLTGVTQLFLHGALRERARTPARTRKGKPR